MSYFSRYDKGEWAVLCDVCGRKMRSEDLRQRWDGLKVCNFDWEPRQPQDFVRGVADYQAPSWTRPEPSNQFIPVTIIYDNDGQPIFPIFYSEAAISLNLLIVTNPIKSPNAVNGISFTLNNITLG
jgi:hypothetical protein